MTPFTDLMAALEEAEYLATETRRRHAIVLLPTALYGVLPLAVATARNLTALEIIRP